jgi:hypothetical protein
MEQVNGLDPGAQNQVAAIMLRYARRAWDDLCSHEGRLRFEHDHYMKMWALTGPVLPGEFIMLDEAQDTNPVLEAIFLARLCFVAAFHEDVYRTGAIRRHSVLAPATAGTTLDRLVTAVPGYVPEDIARQLELSGEPVVLLRGESAESGKADHDEVEHRRPGSVMRSTGPAAVTPPRPSSTRTAASSTVNRTFRMATTGRRASGWITVRPSDCTASVTRPGRRPSMSCRATAPCQAGRAAVAPSFRSCGLLELPVTWPVA